MKILHLVSQDNGGAGRAAVRLHEALLLKGIESKMLVQTKTTNKEGIDSIKLSKFKKSLQKSLRNISLLPFRSNLKKSSDYFSPNIHIPILSNDNKEVLEYIESSGTDIVHLHWIEGGFINIRNLSVINKPLIWSLHDENPYTGGCHYIPLHSITCNVMECNGMQCICETCVMLPNETCKVAGLTFRNKQESYRNLNLHVNGLSSWIAAKAKSSALLHKFPNYNLPNPINTNIYKPINKQFSKEILNLSKDKITLAFGAIGGSEIKRKGFGELKEALSKLDNKDRYELVVFGGKSEEIEGMKMVNLGMLHDENSLVLLYNAADIFIQPSLAENLSNAIMESLACGTPVIAFDIGGNGDMIEHMVNGYLAEAFDTTKLKEGIEWIANLSMDKRAKLASNARRKVEKNFSYEIVASRYIEVYERILGR